MIFDSSLIKKRRKRKVKKKKNEKNNSFNFNLITKTIGNNLVTSYL